MPVGLQPYQAELIAELKSAIGSSRLPLYDMMRYHLGWVDELGRPQQASGGKLLRPTLLLLACEGAGGDWRRALPAAAAVELVHNFSLIHDDIEDSSPERRHRLTVWKVWGQAQAINAGDAMLALSHQALLRLENRGIARDRILTAVGILDETCLKLCTGQYLDISYESRSDIGVEDYLEMVSNKTGALMECSLHLGALLGREERSVIDRLRSFGRNLGMAFQIQDDVMGIWGEEATSGKPSASDIRRKKKTLPIVYGLGQEKGEELLRSYQKATIEEEDVARVMGILNRLGAREYAQDMAERYFSEALSELEAAGIGEQARGKLHQVVAFLRGREY